MAQNSQTGRHCNVDAVKTIKRKVMGWDICTIGKHSLKAKTFKELGEKLSCAFHINVECVYNQHYFYEKDKNTIRSARKSQYRLLWKIEGLEHTNNILRLIDNTFGANKIYQQLGEKKLSNIKWCKRGWEYEGVKEDFYEDLQHLKNGFDIDGHINNFNAKWNETDFIGCCIVRECANVEILFDMRWRGLYSIFLEETSEEYYENNWDIGYQRITKIRKQLKKYYNSIGCDAIFYFPDQGPAQFIFDHLYDSFDYLERYIFEKQYYDEYAKSIQEYLESLIAEKDDDNTDEIESIKEKLKSLPKLKEKEQILNVSDFFKNGCKLYPADTFFGILYDDFSDLID